MHALILVAALAVAPIMDRGHGFSFTPPDGYAPFPAGLAGPHVIQSFMRGQPEGAFGYLRIETMGGTIDRGSKLDPAIVERAARDSVKDTGVELGRFEYRKTKWKSFTLDLVVTYLSRDGRALMTLGTQVPLRHDAIQLELLGPAADEKLLLGELQSILTSLDGESSWLTDEERGERLGRAIGLPVGVAIAVAFILFWRRRRARIRV